MYNALEKLSFLFGITFVKANEDFMQLWIGKIGQQNEKEEICSNKTSREQHEDQRTIEMLKEKLGLLHVSLNSQRF